MIDPERARRFGRQILLLGEEGQGAVDRAPARVGGAGEAHAVAGAYARAAGFAAVVEGPIDLERLAPSGELTFAAPRAVLAGARAALAEIVAATIRSSAE